MPIVRLAMAARELGDGEELLVEATDPAFLADVRAWAKMAGYTLAQEIDQDVKQVVVRRGAPA